MSETINYTNLQKDIPFSEEMPFSPLDSKYISEAGSDETKLEKNLVDKIFTHREFLISENWLKSILVSGRVVHVTKNFVNCECIIHSGDKKDFQIRQFPKTVFEHLSPIQKDQFVKIKLSQKPGSIRIDIYDGKGLGVKKEFESEDIWKELQDFEMDKPM